MASIQQNKQTDSGFNQEETEVMAAMKNPGKFKPLYERYFPVIFRFVYRKVKDENLTADITSQVFVKALVNLKKYTFQGHPFSSWLYKIAYNEIMMHYRTNKRQRVYLVDSANLEMVMEELEEDQQTTREIQQQKLISALQHLDRAKLSLIDLKFFEKKTYAEISDIMSVSESALKVRVFRIMDELRTLLKDSDDEK